MDFKVKSALRHTQAHTQAHLENMHLSQSTVTIYITVRHNKCVVLCACACLYNQKIHIYS